MGEGEGVVACFLGNDWGWVMSDGRDNIVEG